MSAHCFAVLGMPRTKKTSDELGWVRGRIRKFPAKAWREWAEHALLRWSSPAPRRPLAQRLNCRALFFLAPRQHGDAAGYYQGLADLLEKRGVVENDRLLVSWDGSRLIHDRSEPRIEVELTPVSLSL